jgi:hypothetical protein
VVKMTEQDISAIFKLLKAGRQYIFMVLRDVTNFLLVNTLAPPPLNISSCGLLGIIGLREGTRKKR